MDPHALNAIEFPEVLRLVAERCETSTAAQRVVAMVPSRNRETVLRLLQETDEAKHLLETDVVPSLAGLREIGTAVEGAERGQLLPGDTIYQVYEMLVAARRARSYFFGKKVLAPTLAELASRIVALPELESLIAAAVFPDGQLKDTASAELGRLRARKTILTARMADRMQALCNRYRSILSDSVVTRRSGRWCLPVRADHKGALRGIVHDTSATGHTVFMEPEEVVTLGNELREVEALERHEEERILREISSTIGRSAGDIVKSLEACYVIDVVLAKARFSLDFRCVRARLEEQPLLNLCQARHPLIPPEEVVPTDLEVGQAYKCLLITGPNTGGKTVAIKLAGLCAAMNQCGLHIPAVDAALSVFPQIWADIGDEQSLQQSLSTFSAHLRNIKRMLDAVVPGALVLLDEIGAGTDPTEGAALAKAILKRLLEIGALVVCSTHYGELKAFAYNNDGMQNASMEFDVESLRPTFRVRLGVPGASHALTIAERFGIPESVLKDARSGLSFEHQEVQRMLEKLNIALQRADAAKAEFERLATAIEEERKNLQQQLKKAEEARRKAREEAAETVDSLRREIREEAERLFEQLRQASGSSRETEKIRRELKDLDALAREVVASMEEVEAAPVIDRPIVKGDYVRIRGYTQVGRVVSEPVDNQVRVSIGSLRMSVPLTDLELVEQEVPPKRSAESAARLGLQRALSISRELHLRYMRAEEAEALLAKYIDDAILAGLDEVRIVHGRGTGVLRKLVHEFLNKSPYVAEFHLADEMSGGAGVTIVKFQR